MTILSASVASATVAAILLLGCGKERIVGEAGGAVITASEFRERYKKYIETTGDRENILVREKILNNMMNECLIFREVDRQGFGRDSAFQSKIKEITAQALLDAYARRMTSDTLHVTDVELMEEFRESNTRVSARYVYAPTEEGARKLRHRIEAGESFERVAQEVFHDSALAASGGSLGFFGYGDMERALEKEAFTLPVGQLSDPVRLRVGYAVIRVDKRVEKPLSSEYDYAKAKPGLEKTIRDRKTIAILKREANAIEAELEPRFNDRGLEAAYRWWADQELWNPVHPEHLSLPDTIGGLPFVGFRGGAWSVGRFLMESEAMRKTDRRRIRSADDVKDAAIGLLTRQVLLERARRDVAETDEGMLAQIRTVREEYLLRRWKESILDTLGPRARWNEDSLRARYEANRKQYWTPAMVNVAEIIVASDADARGIVARLRAGEKFGDLARRLSIRRWSAERNGELGFCTRELFGLLADKFFRTSPGHLIGPERVGPFVGIFKVIAKRNGRPKTFEEARDDVIADLMPKRQEAALQHALDALRADGGIRIDMEALSQVDVSSK